MAPTPKRAGPRRSINVSGAIAAESCQHFVTMFGDYNRMTRDENLNAMIQELRERSGLPATCMKAAKIRNAGIVEMLEAGVSWSKIQNATGGSRSTITRLAPRVSGA